MALQANKNRGGGARKGAGRKPSGKPRGGKRPGAGRKKGPDPASFQSLRIHNETADSLTIMREHMRYCRALAANAIKRHDHKNAFRYMREAATVAKDIAPFEHSKLATTVIKGGNPEEPVQHKLIVEFVDAPKIGL